jgi:hypothetical protein
MRITRVFFCLLISFAFIALPSEAASPLDEACSSYAQHNYAKSLSLIDQIPAKAQSAKSDYYRALNLQALHRYAEASNEFRKVATQKKDVHLATMARQGLSGLAHMPKYNSSSAASGLETAAAAVAKGKGHFDAAGNFEDDKWKVVKAPDPSKASKGDSRTLWTVVQTRPGCGRH